MYKGQGSLEYLIIIAAVLIVAGVVVLLITNSTGGQKSSYVLNTCKAAASECKITHLADSANQCVSCDTACTDPTINQEVFTGAISICKSGRPDLVYQGSPGPTCGDGVCDINENSTSCPADCPVPPACTSGSTQSCTTNLNCPGTQTCGTNSQWGVCTDVPNDNCPAAQAFLVTTTASPTSGSPPLIVGFACSVLGGTSPYTYSWNFGDGQTSTSQNPFHTYTAAGTYTATCTVTDSSSPQKTGTSSKTITVAQVVDKPPIAKFSYSQEPNSLIVDFDASLSYDADGTITSYFWDFGDGGGNPPGPGPTFLFFSSKPLSLTTGTGVQISHAYLSAGTYTVTLTLTDNGGMINSTSKTITVTQPGSGVTVTTTAAPTSGVYPLAVSFTCSASGGTPPYTYLWMFGDGGSSTTKNPSHTYQAAGTYTATCTATDSVGAAGSSSKTITVQTPVCQQGAICTSDFDCRIGGICQKSPGQTKGACMCVL